MDLNGNQSKANKRKHEADLSVTNGGSETGLSQKKMTKKRKTQPPSIENGAAVVSVGDLDPPADDSQNRVSKKKQKKKQSQAKVEISAIEVNSVVNDDLEKSEVGKERKKKKKQKKGLVSEDCDNPVEMGTALAMTEKKRKGEKKKVKILDGVTEADALPVKQESASVENGSGSRENASLDALEINVTGRAHEEAHLQPVRTFSSAQLPPKVLEACGKFDKPSPIQSYAWPVLRGGRDFIGIARTGSGKTLAFGVPAVLHILAILKAKGVNATAGGPLCLMMAPTRELAQQISDVVADLGRPSKVDVVCVYGGTSKGPQRSALRKHPAVVVATPGRLLDLMEEGCCSVAFCSYVVLDEADRMLDLGFEPAIRAILKATAAKRQTVMLSATWPLGVGQLADEFVKDPIKVTIGSQALAANHDVTQIVEVVEDRARDGRLDVLLREYHSSRKNRVLVFVLYKKEAVRVEQLLTARGWAAGAVHGDKGQADRTRAVAAFKDGSVPLLIATDVAARGLDIPDVEYVINYSFPLTVEDYVHRIGRTGRAGRKGMAHTFFTHNDRGRSGELVNVLREAGQKVPEELLKFGTTVKKKESKLYGAHFRELSGDAPKAQKTTFADSDDE